MFVLRFVDDIHPLADQGRSFVGSRAGTQAVADAERNVRMAAMIHFNWGSTFQIQLAYKLPVNSVKALAVV